MLAAPTVMCLRNDILSPLLQCVRRTVTFLWLNTLDSQQNAVSVGELRLLPCCRTLLCLW
jgi:hypothetical protein